VTCCEREAKIFYMSMVHQPHNINGHIAFETCYTGNTANPIREMKKKERERKKRRRVFRPIILLTQEHQSTPPAHLSQPLRNCRYPQEQDHE